MEILKEKSCAISIRRAVPNDLRWIIPELRTFSNFYGTKKNLFEENQETIDSLLGVITDHVFIIAEKNGEGIGFICGLINPHIYNRSFKILTELFWWVNEQNRNSKAGLMLLKEFINTGKENADWITFGLMETTPVKEKSILKYGFKKMETNFLMEV